jgi:hypothetical protein
MKMAKEKDKKKPEKVGLYACFVILLLVDTLRDKPI